MNKAQKILLKELKEKSEDTELLSSIKKSVDPIGHLRGKPGFIAEIQISATKIYTNIGAIIAPAAVPAAQQVQLPFHIFGLTDFQGGWLGSHTVKPINPNWVQLPGTTGIVEFNSAALPGFLLPLLSNGDMVFAYQDPTGLVVNAFIILHCNNVAYGTFLNSFSSDLIILNAIQYSVPILNLNQMNQTLSFSTQSLFGKLLTDTIDPRMYITNQQFQQQVSNIPVTLPIDKSLIMSSYMDFDCQTLNFILTVQKVKPLTLR